MLSKNITELLFGSLVLPFFERKLLVHDCTLSILFTIAQVRLWSIPLYLLHPYFPYDDRPLSGLNGCYR